MTSGHVRTAAAIGLLLAPACAVKLSDTTDPLPNGGVTGPAADCSTIQILPKGSPGTGAAAAKLIGRFDLTDPMNPVFDWPGTYIEARFQGTSVTAHLETFSDGQTKGDPNAQPPIPPGPFPEKPIVFAVSLDGGDPIFFTVEPGTVDYAVATGVDASAPHVIRIQRESEAVQGPIRFRGIDVGGGKLLPPIDRPRRMEIIGDSITCGYGDRGANATCPFDVPDTKDPGQNVPVSESNYLAYGSVAARALDADLVTLCFSGKGVYINYTEASALESSAKSPKLDANDPIHLDSKTTITDFAAGPGDPNFTPDPNDPSQPADPKPRRGYYLRTRAGGTQDKAFNPIVPLWDFKDPEPQVVVINIGTNDFARDNNQDSVPDGTINEQTFEDDYLAFVRDTVRAKRPNAHIFLALPPMVTDKFPLDNTRSDMRRILNSIVSRLGDPKIYFIELVQMGTRYGLGCDYHPNLEVHRIMADQVAGAIRTKTCW
jgi:lysophospholipase L1-like esterase